jgi:hypothetical protein
MIVPTPSGKHRLQGITADTSMCAEINPGKLLHLEEQKGLLYCFLLKGEQHHPTVEQHPTEMQALITEFTSLFDEPQGLPPQREFDHAIPLLPGAQPINIRPYRYNPDQKDEIERQIVDMLANGIIQASLVPSPLHYCW